MDRAKLTTNGKMPAANERFTSVGVYASRTKCGVETTKIRIDK